MGLEDKLIFGGIYKATTVVPNRYRDSSNDHQIKMKRLQQENRKLKQQISNSHQMKNQQKEFIEWLESNLEVLEMCDRELILTNNKKEIKVYKEILSKYKEIIGGKHE